MFENRWCDRTLRFYDSYSFKENLLKKTLFEKQIYVPTRLYQYYPLETISIIHSMWRMYKKISNPFLFQAFFNIHVCVQQNEKNKLDK